MDSVHHDTEAKHALSACGTPGHAAGVTSWAITGGIGAAATELFGPGLVRPVPFWPPIERDWPDGGLETGMMAKLRCQCARFPVSDGLS